VKQLFKIIPFLLLLSGFSFQLQAQKKKNKQKVHKVEEKRFTQEEVLDSLGEISKYNTFIPSLNGDSARLYANGEKLQGWKEDYYKTGKLLHKGLYKNGQLEMLKNYFENGKLERVMAVIDSNQTNLEIFYDNGNQRRQVNYWNGKIKRYSEFYTNNLLKVTEEYNELNGLLVKRKTWYTNGQIESELFIQDPKTKKYKLSTYHSNGKLAESGYQLLSKDKQSFKRTGNWTIQDSTGKKKNKSY